MPTVLRWRGYRFFFFAGDGEEPPHVHVYKDGAQAKIWLHNCSVARSSRFNAKELSDIVAATRRHRDDFLRMWNDFFGD